MPDAPLDLALRALADGDRDAFDVVWHEASPRVQALTRRLLGDGPDADETAQIALCKVFERVCEYDPERPALPWILGVAAWECRTTRRRLQRRREQGLEHLPDLASARPTPERSVIDAELEAALTEAMGRLRPVDREVLEVVLGQRDRPGIPGATFRKRVQRAIERLRLAWGERHDVG